MFQRCCLLAGVKSTAHTGSQPETLFNATCPLFVNLRRLPLWADGWNVTEAACNGRFPGASHGRFLPMFLISFLVSYSAPFSLFQVLLSPFRGGRPTEQVGLRGDSWACLLEQTQHGLSDFRITSLSHWALSVEKVGVGSVGSHPFYEDHSPQSVCIFVFFCSCPSFSHHRLSLSQPQAIMRNPDSHCTSLGCAHYSNRTNAGDGSLRMSYLITEWQWESLKWNRTLKNIPTFVPDGVSWTLSPVKLSCSCFSGTGPYLIIAHFSVRDSGKAWTSDVKSPFCH